MKLLDIPLRRPTFTEFTAASAMGVGLWSLAAALLLRTGEPFGPGDATALLVVCWWACVGVRCGLDLRLGRRAVLLHAGSTAALLGINSLVWQALG